MTDPYIEKILNADVYDVAAQTPLTQAQTLSERMGCDVRLKREDLQPIFSFKCRGAYNKMASLSDGSVPAVWLPPLRVIMHRVSPSPRRSLVYRPRLSCPSLRPR